PSEDAGGGDAVEAGHSDVHEYDVGEVLLGEADGVVAVGGLADDVDVVLGVEDHAEPGSDEFLVVDDEHFDAPVPLALRGIRATTANPPSGRYRASSWPPKSATRSRMPTIP